MGQFNKSVKTMQPTMNCKTASASDTLVYHGGKLQMLHYSYDVFT